MVGPKRKNHSISWLSANPWLRTWTCPWYCVLIPYIAAPFFFFLISLFFVSIMRPQFLAQFFFDLKLNRLSHYPTQKKAGFLPLKPKGDKFYKVSPSHSCFGNALHPKSSESKSLLSLSYPALVLKLWLCSGFFFVFSFPTFSKSCVCVLVYNWGLFCCCCLLLLLLLLLWLILILC